MKRYRAKWATTWYSCDNYQALLRVLRELGVRRVLRAVPEVASFVPDEVLKTIDVIVWDEEVEG